MDEIFVEDSGFPIPFTSQVDLTGMTNVRMLISKPGGAADRYDFDSAEFGGVGVGGTLMYLVRETDLAEPGDYFFQVIAKDAVSNLAFKPFSLKVNPRILRDSWG